MTKVRITEDKLAFDSSAEDDTQGRRKVKAVIRNWMSNLEAAEGWQELPQTLRHNIRRSMIRAVWSAYKIGLFVLSPVGTEEAATIDLEE